jgi:hypothetical protein
VSHVLAGGSSSVNTGEITPALVTIPFVALELHPGVDIWTVRLFPSVATVLTTNFYHIALNTLADQILLYKGLVTSLAFPFLQ